jgi:hypothetical protein
MLLCPCTERLDAWGASLISPNVILPTPVLRAVALDDLGDAHVSVSNVSISA